MTKRGSFGYKIGKKLRLMQVDSDAELLWQICVREIYLLIKHYGSIDALKEGFENLKDAKGKPSKKTIESCKVYSNISSNLNDDDNWSDLLRYCQHSFINILNSGYFLNSGCKQDYVFIIDFNTNELTFNAHNWNPQTKKYDNIISYEKATIDEILEFEDMPIKTVFQITEEMNERFNQLNNNLDKINGEKNKIQKIINKAKELGSDHNILERAKNLMYDMDIEKRKLFLQYRYFYNRMDALNLIDHTSK